MFYVCVTIDTILNLKLVQPPKLSASKNWDHHTDTEKKDPPGVLMELALWGDTWVAYTYRILGYFTKSTTHLYFIWI